MSKRKSYMNKNGILTEGFFAKIKKMFGLDTSQEKKLRKNKKVKDSIKSLNKRVGKIEKMLDDEFKNLGIDQPPIKLDRYKVSDFIKE